MDKILLEKFKSFFVFIAVLLIICVVMIAVFILQLRNNAVLNDQANAQEAQLLEYVRLLGASPSSLLETQQQTRARLLEEFSGLERAFQKSESRTINPESPIQFKQELFKIQEQIAALAQAKNAVVPPDLGFAEYRLEVPRPEQVRILGLELFVMREIAEALLDSNVRQVQEIKFAHEENFKQTGDSLLKDKIAGKIRVVFSFEADYPAIKKFLLSIAGDENLYMIQDLKIGKKEKSADSALLSVEIIMDYFVI